jgi:hypothetical protein
MKIMHVLGHSQNHLAVAGGYAVGSVQNAAHAPTRYREVVLTVSKSGIFCCGGGTVLLVRLKPPGR